MPVTAQDTANDELKRSFGCGSFMTVVLIVGIVFGLFLAGGSKAKTSGDSGSAEQTRSGVASGNQVEVGSRNQAIFALGDVNVNNCYGDGSCVTIVTDSSDSSTTTIVDGDMTGNGVVRKCIDKSGNGFRTNKPCPQGYMTVED